MSVWTGKLLTNSIVVGIEKVFVLRLERLKLRLKRLEDKGLKKPCGMGQMPLNRARFGHGL